MLWQSNYANNVEQRNIVQLLSMKCIKEEIRSKCFEQDQLFSLNWLKRHSNTSTNSVVIIHFRWAKYSCNNYILTVLIIMHCCGNFGNKWNRSLSLYLPKICKKQSTFLCRCYKVRTTQVRLAHMNCSCAFKTSAAYQPH